MKTTTVLFDLDGTIVPMDQEIFVKDYFSRLVKKMAVYGYAPDKMVEAMWQSVRAMIKNDGQKTNEEVFWKKFSEILGQDILKYLPEFDEFYETEFDKVKTVCGYNPEAAKAVRAIKDMGYRVALATNPLFPRRATELRISWAGLTPDEFELFTTYEDICYCKPNLEYYKEVVKRLGVSPEECLMVGNDVGEDMITEKLGMKTFLITDCIINKDNTDISIYPNGNFADLVKYVEDLNR